MARAKTPKTSTPAVSDEPQLTLPPPPDDTEATAPTTSAEITGADDTAPAVELPDIRTLKREDLRVEISFPMGLTQARVVHDSGHAITLTRTTRERIEEAIAIWLDGRDPNNPTDA